MTHKSEKGIILWGEDMKKKTVIFTMIIVFLLGVLIVGSKYKDRIVAEFYIGDPKRNSSYAGVLSIPSVDINLPCVDVEDNDEKMAKLLTDKSHCAAKIWYPLNIIEIDEVSIQNGTWVICDHDYQGFDKIMDCELDDDAYFETQSGTILRYKVKNFFEGYVNEYGLLVDSSGEEFLCSTPPNLVLMTCFPSADVHAEEKDRRYFVYLELVDELTESGCFSFTSMK